MAISRIYCLICRVKYFQSESSFQTQPDTRMRAGGWLVLAVLAGAAVAVPQEVSPLGSAAAGDLETRAR